MPSSLAQLNFFPAFKVKGCLSGPNRPKRYAVRVPNKAVYQRVSAIQRGRKVINCDSNIPPSHRIPRSNINQFFIWHDITCYRYMAYIRQQESNDIVSDYFGLCGCVENSNTNHTQKQVDVPKPAQKW